MLSFTSMSPSNADGDHREIRREDVIAALPVEAAQSRPDGRKHRVTVHAGGGERRQAQECPDERDALEPEDQVRARGAARASAAVSRAVTRIRRRTMSARAGAGMDDQIAAGVGQR